MTRRLDEVIDRAEIAKAAAIALPGLQRKQLARALGISRGQLNYYLSGKFKPYIPPAWARSLFVACARLNFGDLKKAAEEFRSLAAQLETLENGSR